MQHKETLISAAKIIDARGNEYGDMVETHKRIARLFNDMVPDVQLQAHHIAAVHMATKLARIYAQPQHEDSYVDLTAYTSFRSELVGGDTRQPNALDLVMQRRRDIDTGIHNALDQL